MVNPPLHMCAIYNLTHQEWKPVKYFDKILIKHYAKGLQCSALTGFWFFFQTTVQGYNFTFKIRYLLFQLFILSRENKHRNTSKKKQKEERKKEKEKKLIKWTCRTLLALLVDTHYSTLRWVYQDLGKVSAKWTFISVNDN